jgi:hypothetical protein
MLFGWIKRFHTAHVTLNKKYLMFGTVTQTSVICYRLELWYGGGGGGGEVQNATKTFLVADFTHTNSSVILNQVNVHCPQCCTVRTECAVGHTLWAHVASSLSLSLSLCLSHQQDKVADFCRSAELLCSTKEQRCTTIWWLVSWH